MNAHSHGLNNHTHSFTPSGTVSSTSLTGYAYIRPPTNKGTLGTGGILSLSESIGAETEDSTNGTRPYKLNINATHSHTFSGTADTTGGNSDNTTSVTSTGSFSGSAGTTGASGSGTAFSIMPPYVVKYCFERTA